MRTLENQRQPIINPYENVTDTSGNLANTYANLGVATEAAQFQAEQADISLANTLDTLRATGASAGGATALAQAALQSKNKYQPVYNYKKLKTKSYMLKEKKD